MAEAETVVHTAPTSRLCVKGLPKHVNEAQLREHFAKKGEVTDAKVLRTRDRQSRQMAFIGYKTVQQAEESLRYFDKTFMGTSRLHVEYAAKVGDAALPRPWSKYSKGSSANHKKRTAEEPPPEEVIDAKEKKTKNKKYKPEPREEQVDPKLAEFLALMQPRSKTRAWANDELEAPLQNVSKRGMEQLKPAGKGVAPEDKSEVAASDDEEDGGEEDGLYQDLVKSGAAQGEKEDSEEGAGPKDRVVVDTAVSDLEYLKSRMRTLASDDEEEHETANEASDEEGTDHEHDDEDEDDDADDDPQSPRNNAAVRGDQSGVGARTNTAKANQLRDADEEDGVHAAGHADGAAGGRQPVVVESERSIAETGRLFVRNLPFATTEGEILELFQQYGALEEVHLVLDRETKRSKGFAYVSFVKVEDAVTAASELDCSIFQGRLLHILPAQRPPSRAQPQAEKQAGEEADAKGPSFKNEREAQRKAAAGSRSAWNTLFMRQDTVAEAIAAHYGVAKSQLLDRDSDDLAVRMALGEAHVISQTKQALAEAGVDVGKLEAAAAVSGKASATKSIARSDSALLVKNLPYTTTEAELEDMFSRCGGVARIVLPPTHTLAIVEFFEPQDARKAFKSLAYKKYQHVPLYLEWAPKDVFTAPASVSREGEAAPASKKQKRSVAKDAADTTAVLPALAPEAEAEEDGSNSSSSLYVKNLSFSTNASKLRAHFDKAISALGGRLVSCKLMMRKGPDGKDLSRGFGFVEVDREDVAREVLKQMQGTMLDGHQLSLQLSRRKVSSGPNGEAGKSADKAKPEATTLVVRNLAFEATTKDVMGLFSPFGHIKACRLPKKFDGTIRGFAFVEFVTKQEAKQAMEGVTGTHLYGRRLVVEYAKEESTLDELRAKTAAKFKGEAL